MKNSTDPIYEELDRLAELRETDRISDADYYARWLELNAMLRDAMQADRLEVAS